MLRLSWCGGGALALWIWPGSVQSRGGPRNSRSREELGQTVERLLYVGRAAIPCASAFAAQAYGPHTSQQSERASSARTAACADLLDLGVSKSRPSCELVSRERA